MIFFIIAGFIACILIANYAHKQKTNQRRPKFPGEPIFISFIVALAINFFFALAWNGVDSSYDGINGNISTKIVNSEASYVFNTDKGEHILPMKKTDVVGDTQNILETKTTSQAPLFWTVFPAFGAPVREILHLKVGN